LLSANSHGAILIGSKGVSVAVSGQAVGSVRATSSTRTNSAAPPHRGGHLLTIERDGTLGKTKDGGISSCRQFPVPRTGWTKAAKRGRSGERIKAEVGGGIATGTWSTFGTARALAFFAVWSWRRSSRTSEAPAGRAAHTGAGATVEIVRQASLRAAHRTDGAKRPAPTRYPDGLTAVVGHIEFALRS
jgi:hypothetical protein